MRRIVLCTKVKEAIIHPFVFAVFPVLSLYVKNVGKGFLGEAMGIAAGVLFFAALLWLFTGLFVKNRDKSAIIVSVFFLLFFSYGHAISAVSALLEQVRFADKAVFLVESTGSHLLWAVVWGILFVAGSCFVLRLGDLRQPTKFLNVVALALVVIVGVNSVTVGAKTVLMPRIRTPAAGNEEATAGDRASVNEFVDSWLKDTPEDRISPSSSPDIYYVILDMYARADILEEVYRFDNSEFLSFLTDEGFYVAAKSRTNYPHTTHSLASALNLMYLDDVAERIGERSTNFWPLIVMIRNNKVIQQLRNHGYTTMAFSTGYGFSEIRDADIYVKPPGRQPSNFQTTLANLTPLAIVEKKSQDDVRREQILYIIDHLVDATEVESPTFVFAHVPAPHPPYVFGANGEPRLSRPEEAYEYDEYIEAYTDQLAFVSKRMQMAIEDILSRSREPPIIILQADHGPNSCIYIDNSALYFPERMSILNAYYFPDQDYDALYEDITPVNTFRVIFNNYFGGDYEILEDRSYLSDYWKSPYLFVDVTDKALFSDD
jgi:hypothetical protein